MTNAQSVRGVSSIATALMVCVALAGCGSEPASEPGTVAEGSGPAVTATPAGTIGGWRVAVSVEPTVVGPIAVSVRPIRPAPTTDARPWAQHELVLENTGGRPIQFADTDTSAFIGPAGHRRRLLAADKTCGYGYETPTSPIEAGVCLLMLNAFAVEPHSSRSQTITLFQGLRGMERLVPGSYVFEKQIRFWPGRRTPPPGSGRTVLLRVVYEIERLRGSD